MGKLQAVTDIALRHLTLNDLLDAVLPRVRETMEVDAAGVLLIGDNDAGEAFVAGAVVTPEGKLESGAPFVPSGKQLKGESVSELELAEVDIGGYILLEADSIHEAVDIALRAPHVGLGGGTIVRPCVELGA